MFTGTYLESQEAEAGSQTELHGDYVCLSVSLSLFLFFFFFFLVLGFELRNVPLLGKCFTT
jgi:hypothetical protein